jgi:hypothetical protein
LPRRCVLCALRCSSYSLRLYHTYCMEAYSIFWFQPSGIGADVECTNYKHIQHSHPQDEAVEVEVVSRVKRKAPYSLLKEKGEKRPPAVKRPKHSKKGILSPSPLPPSNCLL